MIITYGNRIVNTVFVFFGGENEIIQISDKTKGVNEHTQHITKRVS